MITITLSKLDAIKKIMESPGDTVKLIVTDEIALVHEPTKNITKKNGVALVKKANDIIYNDNDFFGVFSLYGVRKNSDSIRHDLLFVQEEPLKDI